MKVCEKAFELLVGPLHTPGSCPSKARSNEAGYHLLTILEKNGYTGKV
jgi:hypothetical protein